MPSSARFGRTASTVPYPESMPRRNDPRDLSTAAQEYLLALRVSAGAEDGARVTAAQIARHLGVTTQAASEMFRRLVADGLVEHDGGRELRLTTAGSGRGGRDLPPPRPARVAADQRRRPGLGRIGRGGDAPPGRHLAAGRGPSRRDARSPRDLPARQPDRCRDGQAAAAGRPAGGHGGRRRGPRSTGSRRRPRRTRACCRTSRPAALKPGAPITILARSESLDSLTLDGPLGRATLGLRPAALVRVLPGRRRPGPVPQVPVGRERGAPRRPMATTASGSPRARPGRSTSGPHGPRCSTTSTRGTSAGRSSSASRTPTSARSTVGVREGHPRRSPLARPDLGRGPGGRGRAGSGAARAVSPDGAAADVCRGGAAAARRRPGLPVLLHARGARRRPPRAGGGQAAATLRRPLRASHPRRAPCARGRRPARRAALPGRGGGRRLRRHRPRPGRDRRHQPRRRLRHRPRRWHPALPLHGGRRRRRDGDQPT